MITKDEFLARTERKANSCLEWIGYRCRQNYGMVMVRGVIWKASRLSWTIHFGPIPQGMCVLHRCDNPSCVEPRHLFLGTVADNHADMMQKGRNFRPQGEQNGQSKLTADRVRKLRALKGSVTTKNAAEQFNVSQTAVRYVWGNITWRHVD